MKLGTYKHYKGKYYQVIGIAHHSETIEKFVVYYCLHLNEVSQLWVRPLKMFQEYVTVGGRKIKRFTHIK